MGMTTEATKSVGGCSASSSSSSSRCCEVQVEELDQDAVISLLEEDLRNFFKDDDHHIYMGEKLELVESPTIHFKRSDKWTPVYTWLESLNTENIVGSQSIDEWLSKNPKVKKELYAKHSRYHLCHYIRKCHGNLLRKKKAASMESSKDTAFGKVQGDGLRGANTDAVGGASSSDASNAKSRKHETQSRINRAGKFGRRFQRSSRKYGSSGPALQINGTHANGTVPAEQFIATDRDAGGTSVQHVFRSPTQTLQGRELSNGHANSLKIEDDQSLIPNTPTIGKHKGTASTMLVHGKDLVTSFKKSDARERYEILSELQALLLEVLAKSREQMRRLSVHVDEEKSLSRPGQLHEEFDGTSRRRSRDSQQQGTASSSGHVRSCMALEARAAKRIRKGKASVEVAVQSWAVCQVSSVPETDATIQGEQMAGKGAETELDQTEYFATSHKASAKEVAELHGASNLLRCLQEREKGEGLGTPLSPFQVVGRRYLRRWKSFIQGWDSLENQFTGCATRLQQKMYMEWRPCWSAYTSSVAVAAPLGMIDQGVQKVLDVRFHPQNLPQLVCSSNAAPNELLLYNLESGRATELIGHNCQIQAVEYAGDGTRIVSCGSNLVKIWESSTATCLHTLGPMPGNEGSVGHKKKINAISVNRFQSHLVATSGGEGDSQLLLWNVLTGELACDLNSDLRQRQFPLPCMDALEFCSRSLLICGSDSGMGSPAVVQIWDVEAPKNCKSFPANSLYITCLSSNSAATTLITGSGDGTVALFDIRSCGGISRIPLGPSCEVTSVSFSSCGTYFQASSTCNSTLVWDIRMLSMDIGPMPSDRPLELVSSFSRKTRALHCLSHGAPMPTSENAGQMPGFVDEGDQGINDARWLHNSPALVTGCGNGSVAMWDITLGKPCVRHMASHTRCVNTVAISPDNKYICSGGDDQKVVLYHNRIDRKAEMWRLIHPLLGGLSST